MLIALAVLFGLIIVAHTVRKVMVAKYIHKLTTQAVVISTTKVKTTTWNPELTAVGTLTAVNGVNVSSELNGMVVGIYFKSGQMVKEGDPLVQLDDDVDKQTLNTNSAQLTLDKLNYQRQLQLLKTHSTAQSDVDQAYAKMVQSQAAAATAEVNIAKKKIKAPFSGMLGINQINLGQYLTPGQPIVSLQAMDPLFVDFSLPEQYFPELHVDQPISLQVEAYPNQEFKGKIQAINSSVDVSTRSISVRGVIPNQDLKLYPGMFAEVKVILPAQKNVLVIPQTAVNYSLHGDSVYVLSPTGEKNEKGLPLFKAIQRSVKLGERRGNEVVVLTGLKAGEEIVSSGQLKLQPDSIVEVNNSVKL